MNVKLKKIVTLMISFGIIVSLIAVVDINSAKAYQKNPNGPEITEYFTVIDENGKSRNITFEELNKPEFRLFRNTKDSSQIYVTEPKNNHYYVARIHNVSSTGKNTITYDNISNPGYVGYTTGSYAKDAAYIGTYNGKYRLMQAGVIMDVSKDDVDLVEYDGTNISYYINKNGYLHHYYTYGNKLSTSSTRVGYKLDYLKNNVKYYSYDGHYFYESYQKMIDDYKNDTRINSVNNNNPYYNYYQFLSHRSITKTSLETMNNIVKDKVGSSESKMSNSGESFVNNQNIYGTNAMLMFGVAGNESSWGTSNIAKNKNNLFGHGAIDSDPYEGARKYDTVSDCIEYHAKKFISIGYLDNEDYRYRGGHLGDKLTGMNVKYASDPYWGEKAASVNYYYDTKSDYGQYTIGVINGVQKNFKLYQEPSYSAHVTHILGKGKSPRTCNLPIIILDSKYDSSGNKWYKIQSDTALRNDRKDTSYDNTYSFSRDYLYIPAFNVSIINHEKNSNPTYLRGDVNNNKKIDAADYLMVMDTILGKYKMNDLQRLAGDVNKNGKIDAADYLMIMDSILGKIKL